MKYLSLSALASVIASGLGYIVNNLYLINMQTNNKQCAYKDKEHWSLTCANKGIIIVALLVIGSYIGFFRALYIISKALGFSLF